MKKIIYILFFGAFLMISGTLKAQSIEKQPTNVVVAYPNPTKNSLFLKVENPKIKIQTVTFFSILGRPVATYQLNANATKINLDRLKSGKYLMKYTLSNKKSKVKQIIKQ
ncbi:MAG: secretion protein [Flavobacteriales bacterium]|nr:MAG: secretion protein [Flavobacteriales bacterium]